MTVRLLPRSRWAICSLVAVVLLFSGAVARAADANSTSASIEISSDPAEVVIRVTEVIGEIEGDDHPSLEVFGDGRVVRHRPFYFKQPGDFVGQLTAEELHQLVLSVVGKGVMEFDSNTVRESRRQAALEQSTLYNVSDVSTIVIEVRLQSYQPAGSPTRQFDAEKTVAWRGLRADKRRFPQITKIQNLASAWAELISLAERVEAGGGS